MICVEDIGTQDRGKRWTYFCDEIDVILSVAFAQEQLEYLTL